MIRIALPALAAVVALAALLVGVVGFSAMHANEIAADRQQALVKTVIRKSIAAIGHDQESVTIWDDAVRRVAQPHPDPQWLDDNIGIWVHDYYGHDDVYVVDPSGRAIYAMDDGKRAPPGSYERDAKAAADPLIRALRAKLRRPWASQIGATDRTPGAVDLALVAGRPSIVSVKPFIAESLSARDRSISPFLHISVRHLDGEFATSLARQYQLDQARFSRSPAGPSGGRSALLTDRNGAALGYLVWKPFGPGGMMIQRIAPAAAAALLFILAMVGWLLQRIRRSTLQLEASQAQAQHLAFHDPLTGLANRALFNERLTRALADMHRTGTSVALHCFDVDRFKKINDTLGHPAGDELIIAVASRLLACTRAEDIVARNGGDEFAIIQTGIRTAAEAEILCMRVMEAMNEPFHLAGNAVHIGISIGVALAPGNADDRSELARKADIALYQAKANGRGRYVFFTDAMDASIRHREKVERDLRAALEAGDQFEVVYQPLFGAQSQRIHGAEALVRWNHPELGLLSPAMFVPIAEATGLIEPLGEWVLEQACLTARHWAGLTVAVNVSAVQLRNERFAERVLAIVERTGFDPRRLELEITETSFVESTAACQPNLSRLRQAGIRIALDDFGTGYASLTHLQQFPVDIIKIDQSFVHGIGRSEGGVAIIRAIVDLARASGMQVTAEGVETAEQNQFLTKAGCNALQGFLLSTPVSAHRLEAMLGIAPDERASLRPATSTAKAV
jgi:diguanylate cyclase (GGDEF)-like protein